MQTVEFIRYFSKKKQNTVETFWMKIQKRSLPSIGNRVRVSELSLYECFPLLWLKLIAQSLAISFNHFLISTEQTSGVSIKKKNVFPHLQPVAWVIGQRLQIISVAHSHKSTHLDLANHRNVDDLPMQLDSRVSARFFSHYTGRVFIEEFLAQNCSLPSTLWDLHKLILRNPQLGTIMNVYTFNSA